jgi:hypothetical protein
LGARGPHDDFEAAAATIDAGMVALAGGDFDAVRALTDPECEHVTRDGVVRGPERLIADFAPQLERWAISFYLEDLRDGGEGALAGLFEVERRDRESGKLDWKAWPAIVMRVHGGRIVFLEGYIDRREALDALGLD